MAHHHHHHHHHQSYDSFLTNYQHRLKSDINTIADNFTGIINTIRIDDKQYTKLDEISLETTIRAANFTRACESLLKLIWEIKQYQTINDFPLINESITKKSESNIRKAKDIDQVLIKIRDEMTSELYDLEDEYYNSYIKYTI